MSDLAFNINGEPVELPSTTAAMRVRKVKPKGAPEVVYGRDGLPLFLPVDSDVEDLRREARAEGRFRLDPVDDGNRPIPNAQSCYVCVHPIERAPEPAVAAPSAAAGHSDTTAALIGALLESQKQHTELARMYVSQFPVLANAMAGVVRSAGDVGLTTRVPLVMPTVAEVKPDEGKHERDDDASDDDDDDDAIDDDSALEWDEEEAAYSWPRVAQTFAEYVGPHVGPLLAGLPGLGAMLGAQPAKPRADVAPGPDPRDPAPAGAATARPAAGFDPSMAIRLRNILAQLTPAEQVFGRSLLEEISADDMPAWMERLRAMSVAEAVAYVRQMHDQARAAAAQATPAQPAATPSAPTRAATPATAPSTPGIPRREGHRAAPPRDARRGPSTLGSAARSVPTTAPSDTTPPLESATQLHLAAIDHALTLDERTAMRKHFVSLSSSDRAAWIATLLMLPVAEAVAMVRAQLATDPARAEPPRGTPSADAPIAEPVIAEPPATKPRDGSPANRPAAKPAPRRASRNQTAAPRATMASATAPTPTAVAPGEVATLVPAVVSAEAMTSTPPAIGAAAVSAQPSTGEPAAIARIAPVNDPPRTVDRNAHTHLADIEMALAPEERLHVHAVIAALSPEEREVWLDKLLSVPAAEGVAMLRDALGALTTATPVEHPGFAAPAMSPAVESDVYHPDDEQEPDDDQEQNDDPHELDEQLELGDDQEQSEHELNDEHELDDQQQSDEHELDDNQRLGDDSQRDDEPTIAMSDALPTLDGASLAHFQAIEESLTLAEKMRAHELAAQRPAGELRGWYAELREMSIPEAVARIRGELARSDRGPRGSKKGKVS